MLGLGMLIAASPMLNRFSLFYSSSHKLLDFSKRSYSPDDTSFPNWEEEE